MPLQEHSPRRVLALALALATVLCFLPALDNGFVDFDDPLYVTANPVVQAGLTASGVAWTLHARVAGNWHPLTLLSHMLDCSLFGLNPRGHHLTSVLLHTVNVVLLFLLLARLTGSTWRPLAVAALWGLHPLRVESVAWISERKDLLSGLFFLLAVLAYERWARQGSRPAYGALLVAFFLGLLAKPMLVTLPFVLLLLDVWPLRRLPLGESGGTRRRALVVEKLPLLALSAWSSWMTLGAQAGALVPGERLPIAERLANSVVAVGAYLRLTAWPRGLAALYPLLSGRPAVVLVSASAVVLAVSVLAWRLRRPAPFVLVGWFWFLGMLTPVIGLVQVGAQAWADRYTYLPGIGLVMALVWGLGAVPRRWPRSRVVLAAGALAAALALAAVSRAQLGVWRNDLTLWRHAVAATEDNYVAQLNFANALMHSGDRDGALVHHREAVRIAPASMEAQAGLGSALTAMGRPAEAVPHLQEAVGLRPADPRPHVSLAAALADLGQRDGAIQELREALRLQPGLAGALAGLRDLGAETQAPER